MNKPHKQGTTEIRWFCWYVTDDAGYSHERRKLQYRQKIQVRPTDAREWRDDYHIVVWSDWIDVPIVWEDEQ